MRGTQGFGFRLSESQMTNFNLGQITLVGHPSLDRNTPYNSHINNFGNCDDSPCQVRPDLKSWSNPQMFRRHETSWEESSKAEKKSKTTEKLSEQLPFTNTKDLTDNFYNGALNIGNTLNIVYKASGLASIGISPSMFTTNNKTITTYNMDKSNCKNCQEADDGYKHFNTKDSDKPLSFGEECEASVDLLFKLLYIFPTNHCFLLYKTLHLIWISSQ